MISPNEEENNHSEPMTNLEIDLTEDEVEKSGPVYISDHNNRAFRIKTAGLYFGIHAILIFWSFYYLHDTHGKHENLKKWFRNYDWLGCGYDIFATSVLVITLCLVSFWGTLARSGAGYACYAVIMCCYAYLIGFTLRIACKSTVDLDEEICKMFVGLWCGGIGLFIAACLPSPKFNKTIGMAISLPLYIIMLILWRFAYKLDNPKYLVTLGYIVATAVYCWYINELMSIMVTKRQTKYLTNDCVWAWGHLQTDIFAMFWVDLIRKKPSAVQEEDNEQIKTQEPSEEQL